jgi:hypothetical protein
MTEAQQVNLGPATAQRFAASIGMLLSDLELEQDGTSVKVYFDTGDVSGALLGVDAFYDPQSQEFNRKLFAQRRVLVQSLASGAWFGQIGMLSPHQSELLTAMRLGFGIESSHELQLRATQFFRDVGLLERGDILGEEPLSRLRDQALTNFVRRQVGHAETLFKAIQSVSGNWKTRLESLRRRRILVFERDGVDISTLIATPRFRSILRSFNGRRPFREKQASNFADALTMVILMQQLAEFRRDPERVGFPCFYGSKVFFEVVKDLSCESELEYVTPSGIRTSVLRGSDYFVLRAIFRPHQLQGRKMSYKTEAKLLSPQQLREVQTRVESILALRAPLESTAVAAKLDVFGRSLVSIVRDLRQLSFFENVWLPFSAEEDTGNALKQLKRAARVLNSAHFRKGVEYAQREAQKELQQNVETVRHVKSLWDTLPVVFQVHRLRNVATSRSPKEFIRRTGLFRFAVRPTSYDTLFELAKPILEGSSDEKTAVATLIGTYGRARSLAEENLDDIEVSSALLWLVKIDTDVVELLQGHRPALLSLDLIYAASCVRSGLSLEDGLTTLSRMQKKIANLRSEHARGEMGVGLAYVSFHLWRRCKQDSSARAVSKKKLGQSPDEIVAAAIKYAQDAYIALEKWDQAKRVYALNLYLFYMIEAGSDDVSIMQKAALALMASQDQEDVWQYRYDDTIARYFLRLAELETHIEERRSLLESASEFARMAKEKEPEDEQVINTVALIGMRRAPLLKGASED